ncbi:MAG: ATPase [Planctomycetes bacterium]|nr:ATPase [Planctomycetota bacterium]
MPGPAALLVGVDAGGSKTRVVVTAGDLHPLARAEGGPANAATSGPEEAAVRLEEQVRRLLAQASGGQAAAPRLLACGVAGTGRQEIRQALEEHLARTFQPAALLVTSDAEAALAGVDADPERRFAVVLIAGTGSIACGRGAGGELVRAGGHGWLIGDEGSASWIGRRALSAVLRDEDGSGPRTALSGLARALAGLGPAGDLEPVLRAAGESPARLARFFPLVLEAAGAGDAVARRLLREAAAALARLASAVIERLDAPPGQVQVALAGGVLAAGPQVAGPAARLLLLDRPDARIEPAKYPPEIGVMRLALARAGALPT